MNLRRTPFFEQHVEAGARMVPFAGWEMPVQYSGVAPEHLQVRRSVGLFDVSHMGEVRVSGPRTEAALQYLLSNDISAITVGQAQYNVMCNSTGGVVDDLVIYRLGAEEFLICVNASNRDKDYTWMIEHNPFPEDAVFTDEGDDWAQIAVQGRNAAATLAKLTVLDLAGIGTYRFSFGEFAGISGCIVARTGYTGEDGFEVFIPSKQASAVWSQVLIAGEEFGILPIGLGARDTLRLEAKYCLYGHELTDEISPLQAGLGWVTKLGKSVKFLGSDAIAARKLSDSHKLVGLVIEGGRIARERMNIHHQGEIVGWTTSGTRTPSVEKSIAIGYLRHDLASPTTRVQIDIRGKETEAEVVLGPFYKRDY